MTAELHLHYERVLRTVLETPWALQASKITQIAEFLAVRAAGRRFSAAEIEARLDEARAERGAHRGASAAPSAVAVLPIVGTISQRADMFTEFSGGATVERIAAQFREVVADPSVAAVVLDIDSPGGSVYGIDELATEIHQARGAKPIVAVANALAASAAYYVAAAADELVVTPSGEVGSIGVYTMHQDVSRFLETEGVAITLVSAGKYKVEGSPFEPLGEEARAAMQARIDDYYRMFTTFVAKGRGVAVGQVRDGFGQGRVVGARDAVKEGMADRIGTLDETIARLMPRSGRRGAAGAESLHTEIHGDATQPALDDELPAAAAIDVKQLASALGALIAEA